METSSRPLFAFKQALYELKEAVCSLVLMYINSPQVGIQKKQTV